MNNYAYIFVRQDMSPEQQLIQFGHVCAVMGNELSPHISPHELYFVGIGVANEEALIDAMVLMDVNGVAYSAFSEPDMDNTFTAIASSPVTGKTRNLFSKYQTLKFP